VLTHF
jgi:hypothetical protein